MKYILYPILRIILLLIGTTVYVLVQLFHVLWHLKPNKRLLEKITDNLFYCYSHRNNLTTHWFYHDKTFYVTVTPKSLFQFILWTIKYGANNEVLEITKREEKLYEEFCKNNKPQ